MTANQKRRITLMRQNHVGYPAIANELKLPLSTVKAFCRRNGLQASDVLYQLSHATVYINYDGYAIYSMTFKPKAKVGLMTAGWTSCFHDGMPLAFFC